VETGGLVGGDRWISGRRQVD